MHNPMENVVNPPKKKYKSEVYAYDAMANLGNRFALEKTLESAKKDFRAIARKSFLLVRLKGLEPTR